MNLARNAYEEEVVYDRIVYGVKRYSVAIYSSPKYCKIFDKNPRQNRLTSLNAKRGEGLPWEPSVVMKLT